MDGDFFMIHILNYEKSWFLFSAEDSGVSSGAVPSAPPLPTISENEEEEPLLEEDFSVALLEDDQRDFEAGMVVSTSKVGILWGKNLSILSDFLSWEKIDSLFCINLEVVNLKVEIQRLFFGRSYGLTILFWD